MNKCRSFAITSALARALLKTSRTSKWFGTKSRTDVNFEDPVVLGCDVMHFSYTLYMYTSWYTHREKNLIGICRGSELAAVAQKSFALSCRDSRQPKQPMLPNHVTHAAVVFLLLFGCRCSDTNVVPLAHETLSLVLLSSQQK